MVDAAHSTSNPDIRRAQAYMLSAQRPVLWAANLGAATVLGWVLWPRHHHMEIMVWCAASYVLAMIRLIDWRNFVRQQPDDPEFIHNWLRRFSFWTFLGGAIWGIAALRFMDAVAISETVLMLALFMGLAAGSIPALCAHYRSFAGFVVPLLTPPSMVLASIDQTNYRVLGGLLLFYLTAILFFGRNYNRAITQSITLDLENRKLLEDVDAARQLAETSNRDKSRFLASVSHDLRQPLYAMGLYLEAIDRTKLTDRNTGLVEQIDKTFVALDDMFRALIEISRLDAGDVQTVTEHLSLAVLLNNLADQFVAIATKKNIELHVGVTDAIVLTDGVMLSRVLRNLLSNAIKYTDIGEVRIDVIPLAESIEIRVRDTGHGIDSEAREHIFDEYVQLENPERDRNKGLGLGLAVVKRISDLLDYQLALESTPGEGSCFSLVVAAGEVEKVRRLDDEFSPNNVAGLHILLVEDDAAIRRGMRILLQDHGAVVTAAGDVGGVLKQAESIDRPPDILISDYRLPNAVTGFDVIGEIRSALDPELPALLITGDTDDQVRMQAEANDLYLLHKPVRLAQLNKVISELV